MNNFKEYFICSRSEDKECVGFGQGKDLPRGKFENRVFKISFA